LDQLTASGIALTRARTRVLPSVALADIPEVIRNLERSIKMSEVDRLAGTAPALVIVPLPMSV